ncbi:hypothetical protein D1007_34137 [Hordeum vulgare]|nr:hypothetical protein D1007_34137 [Hordeum vulgare]
MDGSVRFPAESGGSLRSVELELAGARPWLHGAVPEEKRKTDGACRSEEELLEIQGTQLLSTTMGVKEYPVAASSLPMPMPRKEDDYDSRLNLPGQELLPVVSEMSSNMSWKQEAQILKEKSVLEKRIAYMRVAFDHQQQDLVDAASKALAYRQDIIEENIRVTYALQFEKQLLHESAWLRVLFRHLREQLMLTEEKVKESQYQITPWQNELPTKTSLPAQSPNNPLRKVPNKSSLDIVPQTPYPQVQSPISSPSPVQARVACLR